jgi:hypothetical protein
MKLLVFETGGRPLALDDLETLQTELYNATYATLRNAPDMVLSGCAVSENSSGGGSIAAGWLWLGGSIRLFDGATIDAFPVDLVQGENEFSDYRAYQTGGSKACIRERQILVQPSGTAAAGTPKLKFNPVPSRTYAKWIESLSRTVGEVQWLANVDVSQYDGTGRGWENRATAGWALCNGQNGTADLRARFVVGHFPQHADYAAVGQKGGSERVELAIAHLPAHSHGMEQAGEHTHGLKSRGSDGSSPLASRGNNPTSDGTLQTETAGRHTHTINETGGNLEHENRPPFYVLAVRQWVGL